MTLLFVLASCGDGGPTDVGQSASKVGGFGIVVEVPAGWSSLNSDEYGLQIAKRSTDLGTHEAPGGPRLTVTPGNTVLPDPEAMIDALAGPVEETSELIEPPQTVSIGGNQGVSVALADTIGDSVVASRYIVVNAGGIDVLRFLLEAPDGQWEAGVAEFEAILGSVVFETDPTSTQEAPETTAAVSTATTLLPGGGTGSAEDLQEEDIRRELYYQLLIDSPRIDPNVGTYVRVLFDPTSGEEAWNASAALADEWCDGLGGLSLGFDELMDLAWSADPAELELLYGSRDNLGVVVALQLEWRCPDVAEELLG